MTGDRRAFIYRVAILLGGVIVSMGLGGAIGQAMQSWWCLAILIPLSLGIGIGSAILAARIEVNSDR